MRGYLRAGVLVAAAAFMGVTTASAADLGRRQALPEKAPPYVEPVYNWTGFYVGINGGGGFGHSSFTDPFFSDRFNVSGGLVGGTLGYNWESGPIVWGLEGDIDWSSIRGSADCGIATTCHLRNDWLGTFRGRLGYAVNQSLLPYITGGLAVGNIKNSIDFVGSSNETKAGWTVGAGLEARISGPWTAKIEYLFVDLGHGDPILGSDAKFHANLVRAGLNYKF
ncbi:MAG TPA: outer membrane protein [Pseudolabrys sp.]|nr:outer membrane protein [Pseudolabrys sp.]